MWTIFSVYYSNSTWNSFLPMSITEAPMITLEIPHRTCEECLRPHKNSFSMTKALGSFVTHIVCPECRERIQLPDSDPEIHLSVKTANIYHRTRLSLLFFTWMQTVDPDQVMSSSYMYEFTVNFSYFHSLQSQNYKLEICTQIVCASSWLTICENNFIHGNEIQNDFFLLFVP